jgi:hypothetical protein
VYFPENYPSNYDKAEMTNIRLCVGASAGGHLNQLIRLLQFSDNWPVSSTFCITTLHELAPQLSEYGPTYVIGECNRRHPFLAVGVFWKAISLVMKQRPDVVVTTGALPLAMVCLVAKLTGSSVVWIDSIANTERLSMSGSFVHRFADLVIVQWPDLANKYKNVVYAGTIL